MKIIGTFSTSLDARKRMYVPAVVRRALGSPFYVTVSQQRCITAYDAEGWQRLTAKFGTLSKEDPAMLRPLFSRAILCEADKRGYIVLTDHLIGFAGLKKDVTVAGCGDTCEFWDTEIWNEHMRGDAAEGLEK